MNPTRAIALASLIFAASLTAHAAELPIASEALESHVTTEVTKIDLPNRQVTVKGPTTRT